jgi:RNA polymerase sigma-70 factor, ECF subfamily
MREDDKDHAGTLISEEIVSMVRSAMGGDASAFEGLIRMFQGGIFSMVYARTQSRTDAEDLVQDVFLKAYRNINTLKDAGVFKAWLYRIAINSVKDFHRNRRFTSLFGLLGTEGGDEYPDTSPDGFDHLANKQFWGRFNAFLKRLPTQQQEVFRLRFLDHLNISEIAQVLGRSESAVKTHLYRATEKFKDEGASLGLFVEETS